MKKVCLIVCNILFSFMLFAQEQFEGEVTYVKTTHSDTIYYVYTIKDDNVRIDEYDKYKRSIRAYILNLQDKSVMVINPNKQLYTKVENHPLNNNKSQNLEVIHTGNYKYINGYKCSQWRVRDAEQNSEVTYWVAGDNFNFYIPMAQVAVSIDDLFLFFKALPVGNMHGVMPMMIENKTLLRAPKSTFCITNIKSKTVNPNIFNISDYQKYENLR